MTKSSRPRILITNDDSIHAPGIRSLWKGVKDFADVTIVAPSSERSASSLAATLTKPLKIHSLPAWEETRAIHSVNGTPADCVKLAMAALFQDGPPDLILSGINRGYNAGRNVLNSGTVGGVMEGVLRGIPGIAFSNGDFYNPDYTGLESFIWPIVAYCLENPIPRGSLFNVNFPESHSKGIKGLKLAKQGRSYWRDNPDRRLHPEGTPYYWLGGMWHEFEEDAESDVYLLKDGYITAVPIHIDQLTDIRLLEQHKDSFGKIFDSFSNPTLSEPS